MIALAFLAIVVLAGDAIGRRWFRFVSWPHRWATAFLVGWPVATWMSYLTALVLDGVTERILLADMLVAAWLATFVVMAWRRSRGSPPEVVPPADRGDRLTIGAIVVLTGAMMFFTYRYDAGTLDIASGLWSDFGPTTAIAQSFAVGDNFPTEYPHFAGEPIRYHFLYYYGVGNLTRLGLDPALANNLLSTASVVAMLVLVMALGRRLFGSAAAGRIGALLFFAHGALSFIPFLGSLGSVDRAIATLPGLSTFMTTGFPYRGEDWGIWTQMVFLNQRHLAGAIGLLLVIVLFLLDRLPEARVGLLDLARHPIHALRTVARDPALPGYVLCGVLAGLLPLWNGAMFIAVAAVLAAWLVLFPRRLEMLALAAGASVVAIPQLLWVRPGTMAGEQAYPAFHWGYVVNDPTPQNVATYLAMVLGPKLLLVGIALAVSGWTRWRVFLAFSGLVGVAFLVQLSVEVLANHKFINAWLIVANVYAAWGLIVLWQARPRLRVPARAIAVALAAVIAVGGVIDLIPIRNQGFQAFAMDGDPLYEWVRTETDPHDVFLTDLVVAHSILLAGRSIHLGWPYYAWSAGYDMATRETWYRDVFADRSPREVAARLVDAGIAYVAVDDGLRAQTFAPRLNEDIFQSTFERAFVDEAGRHQNLVIYRVPHDAAAVAALPDAPDVNLYANVAGPGPGRLTDPRGMAVDRRGTLLVADAGQGRVVRYSTAGNPIEDLDPGSGDAAGPVGVGVQRSGATWVATALGIRRLPGPGRPGLTVADPLQPFADLVDLAVDDDVVYALDAGSGRVITIRVDGDRLEVTSWGDAAGLLRPTGFDVAGDRVVVADTGNARVVVFGTDGSVQTTWDVPEWAGLGAGSTDIADIAVDASGVTWLSSPSTAEIFVHGADGSRLRALALEGDDALLRPTHLEFRAPGSLFIVEAGGPRVRLLLDIRP